MRLLILGDVHGHLFELHQAIADACDRLQIDAAIQVGDFGFYQNVLENAMRENLCFPVPVHAIDGNHEDHHWLWSSTSDSWEQRLNLIYHHRGSIWEIGERRVGFLGGALHADQPQEGLDERWLPSNPGSANWVRDRDVTLALTNFTENPPDLLVTHSCPAGIGIGMQGRPAFANSLDLFVREEGFDPGPSDDVGEPGLTHLWNAGVRPKLWVFGHFHTHLQRTIRTTSFHCVGSTDETDGTKGIRAVVWDSDTGVLTHEMTEESGHR